jgi:hypothetical protein
MLSAAEHLSNVPLRTFAALSMTTIVLLLPDYTR